MKDLDENYTTMVSSTVMVDLQQQFGHLALEQDTFHIDIMDALAQHATALQSYQKQFSVYKKTQLELQRLQTQQDNWDKELTYNSFLLNELMEANFQSQEIEALANQLKELSNVERIQQALQYAQHALLESDQALNLELKKVLQQIQGIHSVFPKVTPISERIESAYIELKDIAAELESIEESIELDQDKLNIILDRFNEGTRLLKKHSLTSTDQLLHLQAALAEKLLKVTNADLQIAEAKENVNIAYQDMLNIAELLTEQRNKAALQAMQQVNDLLPKVGMPAANLKIELQSVACNAHGCDKVLFLFDANKTNKYLK
jgi:DNA repair protein RecN (Recombination protein N)